MDNLVSVRCSETRDTEIRKWIRFKQSSASCCNMSTSLHLTGRSMRLNKSNPLLCAVFPKNDRTVLFKNVLKWLFECFSGEFVLFGLHKVAFFTIIAPATFSGSLKRWYPQKKNTTIQNLASQCSVPHLPLISVPAAQLAVDNPIFRTTKIPLLSPTRKCLWTNTFTCSTSKQNKTSVESCIAWVSEAPSSPRSPEVPRLEASLGEQWMMSKCIEHAIRRPNPTRNKLH
jgi:hypothetical protein